MTQPGIELRSPEPLANPLTARPMDRYQSNTVWIFFNVSSECLIITIQLSTLSVWLKKQTNTYCILCREVRPPSLKKRGVLGMTLNSIWCWCSSSEVLVNVEYLSLPLLSGPLWYGVVVPVRVPFWDQIDLFENYFCLRGILDAI